ncbi:hypothetical protein Bca52824_034409 [Brassica carinata]|uniref:CRAL-TRIO domain-containing protein n=1 Tax=Brassica carinata TaxID=52824 RepID=A0A8X7S1B2_BRACI|nr:hypothetical protein Bca52824_034409 [Brassica carinata]
MEESQELALTQFRKSVEKLSSSTEGYEVPTLMRFLVARSMNPDKAAKMFVDWQKWRASMVPPNGIPDSEVKDELDFKRIYLQGLTISGQPLVLCQVSKHFPAEDPVTFKKFVVHVLDKTIASGIKGKEVGDEKLVALIDLSNITYKNLDARGFITGFQFLQSYYPERLGKCYILHMPGFFLTVWKFICRFLEEATQEKIVIITDEEEERKFKEEIGVDVLPEEYGDSKSVPFQFLKFFATGAVGQDFLSVLFRPRLPYSSIKMLACGETRRIRLGKHTVEELTAESFDGVDIALFSAGGSISKKIGPLAAEKGTIV